MAEGILTFISEFGYIAVFILMVVENVFPPIPSEVILPFVGYSAALGEINLFIALFVATAGSVLGTSIWFAVGWLVPYQKLERFFKRFGGFVAVDLRDFQNAVAFFNRFDRYVIVFSRLLPGLRSVISIPAGCVRMNLTVFLFFTTIGTLIWNTLLILGGFFVLDEFPLVEQYMAPVADGIIYLFIGLYILQVIHFAHRRRKARLTEEIEP